MAEPYATCTCCGAGARLTDGLCANCDATPDRETAQAAVAYVAAYRALMAHLGAEPKRNMLRPDSDVDAWRQWDRKYGVCLRAHHAARRALFAAVDAAGARDGEPK